MKSGRRAIVYKHHGLWFVHSYHVHISGMIRRIAITEYTNHESALRAAVSAVGLKERHYFA